MAGGLEGAPTPIRLEVSRDINASDLIRFLATTLQVDQSQAAGMLLSEGLLIPSSTDRVIRPTPPIRLNPDWRCEGERLVTLDIWQNWQSIARALSPTPESTPEGIKGSFISVNKVQGFTAQDRRYAPTNMLNSLIRRYGGDASLRQIYADVNNESGLVYSLKRLDGLSEKRAYYTLLLFDEAGLLSPDSAI